MINDHLLWFLFANCPFDDVDCVFQQGQCTFIPLYYIKKLLSSYRWYVCVLQARKGLIIHLEITKREEKGKLQIRASNYNFGDKTTYNRINVKYICKTGYPQYRPWMKPVLCMTPVVEISFTKHVHTQIRVKWCNIIIGIQWK
jgi:hypothetical protein